MVRKKTWGEKLQNCKDLPKVVQINQKTQKHWKGVTMSIPSPMEVYEIMAGIPKGKLITIAEIRKMVASKHNADIGCPLTCGIFAWIAANAAVEESRDVRKSILPYWRTLKSNGELNSKYPGGIKLQKENLELEGHKVIQKGRKSFVEGYENKIVTKRKRL
jgi:alkylated DNA nucleotide flippase Atl1